MIRRFSDFIWLQEQLALACPGCIVPALPELQKVGRFDSAEFEDTKRRPLNKFLTRVAAHLELSKAPVFDVFLYGNDTAFALAKSKSAPPITAKAHKAMAWVEQKASGMSLSAVALSTSLSLSSSKPEAESKPAVELQLSAMAETLAQWDALMQVLERCSGALVRQSGEESKLITDFSTALLNLGRHETLSDGSNGLGSALVGASGGFDTLASSLSVRATREIEVLEEPVQEYVHVVACVRRALSIRDEARIALVSARATVVSLQDDYQRQGGTIATKLQAIEKAQLTEHNARVRLERVTDELLNEWERFKQEKSLDLNDALTTFIKTQIDFHKSAAMLLSGLLPQVEGSIAREVPQEGVRSFEPSELRELGHSEPGEGADADAN